MEIELNKRKIEFYDCSYESSKVYEECGEVIIPDSSPDMVRIISTTGRVYIKDKNQLDGSLMLKGTICGSVLYVADGEESVRKLDFNLPFNQALESMEIHSDTKCIVSAELVSVEGREINSRKIAIRSHVATDIKCYIPKVMELAEKVSNDDVSVEIKNIDADFCVPVCIKERSFTIIDDIEIPQSQPMLNHLLKDEVKLQITDMKHIGNKIILKGMANIKCVYEAKDGTILCATHNLPYSQIIEIDDVDGECDLVAKMSIRACDIEASHDMSGDAKYISVNMLVDTALTVCLKYENTLVDDLYSTTHEIETQYEEISVHKEAYGINRRTSVNENIETANPVKKIIDTEIKTDPVRYDNGKLKNNAQIQIIYIAEDNCIYSVEKKCGVECDINVTNNADIACDIEISGVTASGVGNKVSVYFTVDYETKVTSKKKIRNLKTLNIINEKHTDGKDAYVIIKHIYNEQPIWNIAKKYNTTVEEIAAANCLEFTETVAAGSMLLIPCGK